MSECRISIEEQPESDIFFDRRHSYCARLWTVGCDGKEEWRACSYGASEFEARKKLIAKAKDLYERSRDFSDALERLLRKEGAL